MASYRNEKPKFCRSIEKKMNIINYKWNGYSISKIENDQTTMLISDDIMSELKKMNLSGKNAIDGGCNLGVFSLILSDLVGNFGIVYSFDPQKEILKLAIENAKQNGKNNVSFYNVALSDKSGEVVGFSNIDYESNEYVSSGGIKTEPSLCGQPHCGSIETLAIDDLKLNNIGIIKLDIEGYEQKALDGMWETIDRCKPYMIIELSDGYLGDEGVIDTIEKTKSHGYEVILLSDFNYLCRPIT